MNNKNNQVLIINKFELKINNHYKKELYINIINQKEKKIKNNALKEIKLVQKESSKKVQENPIH